MPHVNDKLPSNGLCTPDKTLNAILPLITTWNGTLGLLTGEQQSYLALEKIIMIAM